MSMLSSIPTFQTLTTSWSQTVCNVTDSRTKLTLPVIPCTGSSHQPSYPQDIPESSNTRRYYTWNTLKWQNFFQSIGEPKNQNHLAAAASWANHLEKSSHRHTPELLWILGVSFMFCTPTQVFSFHDLSADNNKTLQNVCRRQMGYIWCVL